MNTDLLIAISKAMGTMIAVGVLLFGVYLYAEEVGYKAVIITLSAFALFLLTGYFYNNGDGK